MKVTRVRVTYLKEENHQFFSMFQNKFLKHNIFSKSEPEKLP